MSLTKSPFSKDDSTNLYLKNLDTLAFFRKLNHIKERENRFLELQPILTTKKKNPFNFNSK